MRGRESTQTSLSDCCLSASSIAATGNLMLVIGGLFLIGLNLRFGTTRGNLTDRGPPHYFHRLHWCKRIYGSIDWQPSSLPAHLGLRLILISLQFKGALQNFHFAQYRRCAWKLYPRHINHMVAVRFPCVVWFWSKISIFKSTLNKNVKALPTLKYSDPEICF